MSNGDLYKRQFLAVGRAILEDLRSRDIDEKDMAVAQRIFQNLADLFIKKSAEYGNSWVVAAEKLDSISSLMPSMSSDLSALLGMFDEQLTEEGDGIGPSSLFVEVNAKHIRHRNLLWENPDWTKNSDRIVETLLDIAVYSILEVMLIIKDCPDVVRRASRLQEI